MKVGDKVKWGNGGHVNVHTGVIVRVVAPWEYFTQDKYSPRCRNHESYVVEERLGKRQPKIYWPPVKQLIVIEQA